MKLAILLCLVLVGVTYVLAQDSSSASDSVSDSASDSASDSVEMEESFDDFEQEFHEIVIDPKEKAKREKALKKSEKEISEDNKKFKEGKQSWKAALNQLSDVPSDEMSSVEGLILDEDSNEESDRGMGLVLAPENERIDDEETERYMRRIRLSRAAPASYDATRNGLVTDVKNQEQCGSCAAFSTVAASETCMLKSGANPNGLDLSEQQLLNCAFNGGSIDGCNGADPIHYGRAFANDIGGQLPHEYTKPYQNKRENCANIANFNTGAKVSSSYGTYRCTESEMKTLVAKHGSVVTGLNADILQNYKGGILDTCTLTGLNHAVVVVGYGTENGVDFWKVRNSWGPNWGESGYFRIRRGTNECGIGGICVAYDCTSSGSADDVPTTQAPPTPPKSCYCDLTRYLGDYTADRVNILFPSGGKMAHCEHGNCRKEPLDLASNGCAYFGV